ncbi:MAG: hypothetical protein ACE5E8_10435, partial [Acidimicrobiia bacterium]
TATGVHLPSPSYYPALTAVGALGVGFGVVYWPAGIVAIVAGALVTVWGLFGWSMESPGGEH